ncbi:uncharacterized protein LTR77_003053 [Saxophila tyrrhenica]|uniref:HIT-type domain-containing protein n=1 Tax=Saxophila tyrrhenica TaxID=1690608 RepID=A0AAV9PGV5_9PEZI|nr:hypothetical protein LTR77_003053 [Saxophila tyrrhenica]
MATGPLRFRTPHIEELPITQSRQAPGFAWVAVAAPPEDPAKNWGTANRKRARANVGGQTETQKEALSARQQREVERKIKELNSDNSKDVQIPIPKKEGGGGGAARAGKTTNTKKILASGKTFAHYLDDEEAEIARTGRRDGEAEVVPVAIQQQRASKTPYARRKAREESSMSASPVPTTGGSAPMRAGDPMEIDAGEDGDADASMPSAAEIETLLNLPPLTYNQARSAPPPSNAPPPRRFCEVCGYFGRAKCMKCGAMTCSVMCKDTHDEQRCLKFYA